MFSTTTPPFSSTSNPSSQAIFDAVCEHLLRQGAPARASTYGVCLYRGTQRRCAVGFLIPDEIYSPEMEETGILELLERIGAVLPPYFHTNKALLSDLQVIHDSWTSESSSGLTFREHVLIEAVMLAQRNRLFHATLKATYGKYKKAPILGEDGAPA